MTWSAITNRSPSADAGPNQWATVVPFGADHFSVIDETIGNKNITDYILESASGRRESFELEDNVPSDMGSVASIKVYLHVQTENGDNYPGLTVSLLDGTNSYAVLEAVSYKVDTNSAWETAMFEFNFASIGGSITKLQYQSLRVRVQTVPKAVWEEEAPREEPGQ